MTTLTRLEQWKEQGIISLEQHTLLAGFSRGEPFSLFLEKLARATGGPIAISF
jgi:hypothetical protein